MWINTCTYTNISKIRDWIETKSTIYRDIYISTAWHSTTCPYYSWVCFWHLYIYSRPKPPTSAIHGRRAPVSSKIRTSIYSTRLYCKQYIRVLISTRKPRNKRTISRKSSSGIIRVLTSVLCTYESIELWATDILVRIGIVSHHLESISSYGKYKVWSSWRYFIVIRYPRSIVLCTCDIFLVTSQLISTVKLGSIVSSSRPSPISIISTRDCCRIGKVHPSIIAQ